MSSTTTDDVASIPDVEPDGNQDADEKRRRRLLILSGLLAAGAIALLILLIWLLRPDRPGAGELTSPIIPVRSIYGYGTKPSELLKNPLGVAFAPDGNVWISDTGHSRVLIFTKDGEFVSSVGEEREAGKLHAPNGIASDPVSGRMYIADWMGQRIASYSTSGRFLEYLPDRISKKDLRKYGPDGFSPYDVKILGNVIVAASNNGLYYFTREGKLLGHWGGRTRGQDIGFYNFPNAFDIDEELGRVYVADSLNRRVVALDKSSEVLWISGVPDKKGRIKSFWQLPRGLVVGPDGNVYVIDTFRATGRGLGAGHFSVLSPDGELISEFGRNGDSDEASFRFPEKVATGGPDGLWAIADRVHGRVLLFEMGTYRPEPTVIESDAYEKTFQDLR